MNNSSHTTSSTPRPKLAGILHQSNKAGKHITSRKIFTGQDIIVGRDSSRCQYTIGDPFVSQKHLRIYTIVYDDDDPTVVPLLVYAQDLSRNGTYWNGSLIGKGNGGFLLSPGDTLRLSSSTLLRFEPGESDDKDSFDLTQEDEMKMFRKIYTVTDRLLGAGQWGKVYMAINESKRCQLACKVVDLRKIRCYVKQSPIRQEQPAQAEDVDNRVQIRKLAALADEKKKKKHLLADSLGRWYREVEILANINHPNIVGMEKAFVTDNTLYIFQELVTAGDLISYLDVKNGRLIENEAAHIIRQIVIAVKFLHEQNIVHRDIKPENILMTTLAVGCRVILTDFGGARKIVNYRQRMTSMEGTHGYHAPEIEIGRSGSRQGYSKAVDMWSIGCVTVVLLTGGSPFRDSRTKQYSDDLARDCNLTELKRSSEWSEISARPKGFVMKLLLLDESRRLTAEQALLDAWFNNDRLKPDFEDLYKRTIRHWQPSIRKKPIIEFMNACEVKQFQCSQNVLAAERRSQGRRGQSPVEPPYIPFPRHMHQPLFPPRRPPGAPYRISDEAQVAIREHWSSVSSSDESSRPQKRTAAGQPLHLQPRKPTFKALRRSPSLGQSVSRVPTQARRTASTFAPNKRQPLVGKFTPPNSKTHGNFLPGPSALGYNRPSTPPPKTMGVSQDLSMRAPSTPNSDPSLSLLKDQRRETDHHAYEAPRRVTPSVKSPESAMNLLTVADGSFTRSTADPENTNNATTISAPILNPSDAVKPNSALKLRTPKSTRLRYTPVTSSKKRRSSIYDMEDEEEIENSENEPKRQKPMWQTAAQAFGRSRQDWSVRASPAEVESILVPRTPSPAVGKRSVYLPRL